MADPELAVVIPVRDAAQLLERHLPGVVEQAAALSAVVIVVDDASSDATADVAERAGATVLRQASHSGPYVARNLGWRSTSAPVLVFTDVRCRPQPGWLAGLRDAIADPAVAIAGGDVKAVDGSTPAARFIQRAQPLMPEHGLGHEVMPYLPTANIVTRRCVLEAVDGFRELRSGGDLDFCWRVQLAGLGAVRYAPDAGVTWLPRSTVREVMRQWYRYGAAKPTLAMSFASVGFVAEPPEPALRWWYGWFRRVAYEIVRRPPREWDASAVALLCQVANRRGYERAWREASSSTSGRS